ncbi:MAG: hypothetical protein E5Y59_05375, partial [Mesorhizobium sp.]
MDLPFHRLANGRFGVTLPPQTLNGIGRCRPAGHCVTIGWRQCGAGLRPGCISAVSWAVFREQLLMARITRAAYAQMYGPTVGDKVRLADTELFI